MSIEHITIILVLSALILFTTGFPIAFALGSVGLVYSHVFFGPRFGFNDKLYDGGYCPIYLNGDDTEKLRCRQWNV